MTKQEFESMAIRGNKTISGLLYNTIEKFYMSANEYHQTHGGVNETKQEFVKRVFGGKINTVQSIAKKVLLERIAENTYCLPWADKSRLDKMNALLAEHTAYETIEKYNSEYYELKKFLNKQF